MCRTAVAGIIEQGSMPREELAFYAGGDTFGMHRIKGRKMSCLTFDIFLSRSQDMVRSLVDTDGNGSMGA